MTEALRKAIEESREREKRFGQSVGETLSRHDEHRTLFREELVKAHEEIARLRSGDERLQGAPVTTGNVLHAVMTPNELADAVSALKVENMRLKAELDELYLQDSLSRHL